MDRNALLSATRARFLQAFLTAADQAIASAVKTLFRKADFSFSAVEQRALLDARRVLSAQQLALHSHFQHTMEQLLTRSFQTAYSKFRPSFFTELSSHDLSLIDVSQFEDQLRVDQTTAQFRNAADQELRDLNIRIALLFEQDTIKERENPFRPWLFTRCIGAAVEALGERAEITTVLIQQLYESIEESVAVIYNCINAQLAENGIAAQLQLKVHRSQGGASPLAGGRVEAAGEGTPRKSSQQLAEAAPIVMQPARPVNQLLTKSIDSLIENRIPGDVAKSDQKNSVRNLIVEQRSTLAASADDTTQQTTIDVVAMLFEFILRDDQTPAEVRAQLGRLQFLLLTVALREPRLLTQKSHPARMLLNRIGAISVGLQKCDQRGARISAEICRIVETLVVGDADSSTLFSSMLDEFDAFITIEQGLGDTRLERAVIVVETAQSRTLRFTHIAAQLDSALSRLTIDPFLRNFVSTSWVYVVERAERSGDANSRRFRALIPDLLWSIQPHADADSRAQLFALLPIIVHTIREGLLLIEWNTTQQQPVLDWLVEAHRLVLRGRAGSSGAAPSPASLHEHFEAFINHLEDGATSPPLAAPKALHQQVFLDQAIREADCGVTLLDRSALDPVATGHATDGARTPALDIAEESAIRLDNEILAQLRTGAAIELNLNGIPTTACLRWVDADQSTLVLAIAGHAELSLISANLFHRMLVSGRLRLDESQPLFERAVAAVLQSAEALQPNCN